MKPLLLAFGASFFLIGSALAVEGKSAPLEVEMGGQVYLCGLKAQLADITKGAKQKELQEEVKSCSENSREKIKLLVKSEYKKYPDGDPVKDKIKAMYSAYLTYMSAALWGKDLTESSEAVSFKEKVSDYKAEVELR